MRIGPRELNGRALEGRRNAEISMRIHIQDRCNESPQTPPQISELLCCLIQAGYDKTHDVAVFYLMAQGMLEKTLESSLQSKGIKPY